MKKISVPMPLISTVTLASKPISSGPSTVPPNIASTCWTPSATVCGHGSRSSGATTMPSAAGLNFQENTGAGSPCAWPGELTPDSGRHHLAVEMPGRVPEDGQDDGEPDQQGQRADHQAGGDDQAPG